MDINGSGISGWSGANVCFHNWVLVEVEKDDYGKATGYKFICPNCEEIKIVKEQRV